MSVEDKQIEGEKSPEEREKELVEKIANLEQDKANLVEEIKGERTKKQETADRLVAVEEELKKAKGEANPTGEPDPEAVVNRVLAQKEQESAKAALEQATEDFKRAHNEFASESDPAGIVFSKFKKELSKYNLNGLKTKEEITERLKEVYSNMNRTEPEEPKPEFYQGTKPSGSDAPINDNATLSDGEVRLLKDFNLSKEQYLKIKEKRPAYVSSLRSHGKYR